MAKKGELKKQIYSHACTFSAHGGKWVSIAQFKKVLDEAKKDYPMHDMEYDDADTVEVLNSEELTIIIDKKNKWFKKWFGSDKP